MTRADDPGSGLEAAARAFAARLAQPAPEPVDAFLRRHGALREWLEPMLGAQSRCEPAPAKAETLGPYRLRRELGRGGMGVVYEAQSGDDPAPVALKVLLPHLAGRDRSAARFAREAELALRLDHPGIVRVIDTGIVGDIRFLAMEFVVGAPLDAVLAALRERAPQHLTGQDFERAVRGALHTPLGRDAPPIAGGDAFAGSYVACVVRLALQLADALRHAHAAGVIHRDIKPSNLLVRADGRAVLTDLGLARGTGVPTVTATGDFAGTPWYVSPEQAMCKRVHVDHRTDLFSMGSTLYELLTLQRPFDGDTTHEVLGRILTKDPPQPERFHPGLAPDLVTVVLKLLEKDPDCRYQSAAELATDLRAFLEYRRVAARRPSMPARALRWMRREPLKAALVLVLAIALPLLAGAAGYVWSRRHEIRAGRDQILAQRVAELVERGFHVCVLEHRDLGAAEFEAALALDPTCAGAQVGLVHAVRRRDGPQAAIDRLDRDPSLHMELTIRDRLRVDLLSQLGRTEEVAQIEARLPEPRTDWELFLHGNRTAQRAELLDYVERAVAVGERANLWIQVHWAFYSDRASDAGSCRRSAESLLRNWPETPLARHAACIALRGVEPERAARLVADALTRQPDVALFHLTDGAVRRARGDLPGAIAAHERAVAVSAGASATAHYALGRARWEAGDLEGAITALRSALGVSPGFVDAQMFLGIALYDTGRLGEALAAHQRAVELHPARPEARFQLGQTLVAMDRLGEGLVELQAAAAASPEDPILWQHVASARFATGDTEGGIAALRAAVAAMPAYEAAHEALAQGLSKHGEPAAERAALEAWVDALPKSVNGWLQLGLYCVDRRLPAAHRDAAAASWAARRALALTEDERALAWFVLGEAHALLGETGAAEAALRRALASEESPLSDAERRRCARRLRELAAAGSAAETASRAADK